MGKITDLKQGVRNLDRVNVFVDGKFSFSLDISQVVDLGIKVGLEISDADLVELKKASEFGKLYQRALEWVLVRPRSEYECREYLYRKLRQPSSDRVKAVRPSLWSSEDVLELLDIIILRLESRGYLDDFKFAEWYVENRFLKKGISAKRLKMELFKKGVSREIIEKVLADSDRNDAEEIKKIIAKKRARYDNEKLTQYLCRQGFQYDLVRELVLEFSETD